MKLGYLGIDQNGQNYYIKKHPRKELLEQLCAKGAGKQYTEKKDGSSVHSGYIIRGNWITVYEVHDWDGEK